MHDAVELRRRLQRLGRRRAPSESTDVPRPISDFSGEELSTAWGPTFRKESNYPSDHAHGGRSLASVLGFDSLLAAEVARQPALAGVPLQSLAFLDTETTGLAGGAGTLAFLVGVGRFTDQGFRLRQYFLRDPAEEPGLLTALQEDIEDASGFVTFNGRLFDLPLLEMRYGIGLRRRWNLSARPHLDLLFPSRRLWKRSLPDCSLSTLEAHLLGVRRSEADVPGALIPALYLDYLRTGDVRSMARVVYHNAVDILTLVGLTSTVLDRFQRSGDSLTGSEALAVARWHAGLGRIEQAESVLRQAMAIGDEVVRAEALRVFTALLRSQRRRGQALEALTTLSQLAPWDPEPCLEAAKYYEWEARDPWQAMHWADRARQAVESWPEGWRRRDALESIDHRMARLLAKQARRVSV
ncbi:MAG TPA: ribonuclease H-like domain-containing protein [Anaerolineales bacterium]|nr:ribonuclease H-like domain-containing protein [Anaerolineales bacterium]